VSTSASSGSINVDGEGQEARAYRPISLPTSDASLIEDIGSDDCIAIEPPEGDLGYAALNARFAREKLIISVTTATAFRCALSYVVMTVLSRRLDKPVASLCDFESAMQEAISNAVLHGNLAISTLEGTDPAALEERIREIQQRLNDPILALRRVTVTCDWDSETISVAVYDEGAGFYVASSPTAANRSGNPALNELAGGGRGLNMIRQLVQSVAIDARHNGIRMTFATGGTVAARSEKT
jgi:anti-sigma regulatory factor (Ser/Thr protein kinase)